MKTQKFICLVILLVIGVNAIGCAKPVGTTITGSREETSNLPATSAFLPTTPTILSSATPTFTLSPVPTLTPLATHTAKPSPSTTSMVIPALPIEDARLRLLDLLSNNGGCRLPCLWGITPGESTVQDSWAILAPLSSISDLSVFEPHLGTIDPIYDVGDGLELLFNVNLLGSHDVVIRIPFSGRAVHELENDRGITSVFDSTFFGEKLNLYMLPQILSEYGRPSSVLLFTLAEVPSWRFGQGYFRIALLYPEQGIFVHYTTEMSVEGENVVGCPSNAHVDLELTPSGSSDKFFELLAPTNWPQILDDYKSVDEVTSMTIEDFYQTFRQPTEECLKTPADLWQVPEK